MADETTITTTTQGWPDDADGRWPDPVSSEKHYYFSDDSDVLYVHDWNVEHPRNYERFVRRPGLHDISGTYVFSRDTNDWEWQSSYEISAESFVEEFHSERNGVAYERWRLAGDLRYDRSNYYMFVSVTDVEQSLEGEPITGLDRRFVGKRFALHMHRRRRLIISLSPRCGTSSPMIHPPIHGVIEKIIRMAATGSSQNVSNRASTSGPIGQSCMWLGSGGESLRRRWSERDSPGASSTSVGGTRRCSSSPSRVKFSNSRDTVIRRSSFSTYT